MIEEPGVLMGLCLLIEVLSDQAVRIRMLIKAGSWIRRRSVARISVVARR
jgi:hypothetical protein